MEFLHLSRRSASNVLRVLNMLGMRAVENQAIILEAEHEDTPMHPAQPNLEMDMDPLLSWSAVIYADNWL